MVKAESLSRSCVDFGGSVACDTIYPSMLTVSPFVSVLQADEGVSD